MSEEETQAIASTIQMSWGTPLCARFIFLAKNDGAKQSSLVVVRKSNGDEDLAAAWKVAHEYFGSPDAPGRLMSIALTAIVTEIDDRGEIWASKTLEVPTP